MSDDRLIDVIPRGLGLGRNGVCQAGVFVGPYDRGAAQSIADSAFFQAPPASGGGVFGQICISGAWHTVTEVQIVIGGAWHTVSEIQIVQGGAWHALVA